MKKASFRNHCSLFLLGIALSLFMVGHALAFQYNQPYGSVWPTKNWSPTAGRLQGSGGIDAQGKRATQPVGNNVTWNAQAIAWMQGNSGTVSITFHSSFDGNTGPSGGCGTNKWAAVSWAASNLPGASATVYKRGCSFTWPNEVRIAANKNNLVANTNYFGQAWYQDTDITNDPKGQFNVDTYWNGSENFHQKYCIPANSNTAGACP
jgi:hypothetical protein